MFSRDNLFNEGMASRKGRVSQLDASYPTFAKRHTFIDACHFQHLVKGSTSENLSVSSEKIPSRCGTVQLYITQTTPPIWSRVRVPVAQDLRRDPAVTHVILRSNCNTISPIFHIWCQLTSWLEALPLIKGEK